MMVKYLGCLISNESFYVLCFINRFSLVRQCYLQDAMASNVYFVSMCNSLVVNSNHKLDPTKFEIRVLLKQYWKQDYKAAAEARRICEVEEGVIGECVAQQWFQRFNTGEENTKNLPYSGRPKLWDIENLHRVLKENLQKCIRRLSEELGASKDIVHC